MSTAAVEGTDADDAKSEERLESVVLGDGQTEGNKDSVVLGDGRHGGEESVHHPRLWF